MLAAVDARPFVGSLLLATLSTVADYVWFLDIPQHQVSSGAIHGATLFAALGAYLGWRKGKIGVGALGGLLSGLVAALSFYVLAPFGGYNDDARLVAAAVDHARGAADLSRWPSRPGEGDRPRHHHRRSSPALGFGVVLFQLYRGWPPETFSFFKHFVAWSMAYLPGLYVLLKR